MSVIFDSSYLTSTFLEAKKYIYNCWTGNPFSEEEFRHSMLEVANKVLSYSAIGILVDARKFDFVISIDNQAWYDQHVVPLHLKAGIYKMAFLLPSEFIPQISIEQTMEETQALAQETRYFDSYNAAEDWLMSA